MQKDKADSARLDKLCDALIGLNNRAECRAFLDDLCTIAEIRSMVQRWEVALMLDTGRTYAEITEETGASTATISRINRCLAYGAGGYRTIIDRLKALES
jgi:TrpR-related protein YerC/YecD